jgi:hypothetical protein
VSYIVLHDNTSRLQPFQNQHVQNFEPVLPFEVSLCKWNKSEHWYNSGSNEWCDSTFASVTWLDGLI